ncbi:MAG: hypothetical protein J6T45_03805 [Fibrobacterales bacterium]|nr:hypothetical protein [Fibrobacterales bacterium]
MVEDLSAYRPSLGYMLAGTEASVGPFDETPFSVTVSFPPRCRETFEKLRRRPDLAQQIQDYFREVVERPVDLKLVQGESDDSAGLRAFDEKLTELAPGGVYEIDLKSFPLLQRLQQLFDASYISTQQLRTGTEDGGQDEHPEDDEGHAEDAEQADAGPV